MDLKIFFSPVDEHVYQDITTYNCFINAICMYGEKMPDYKGVDIALIGIQEEEGNSLVSADFVRQKLYRLKSGKSPYKIVDLGNLRRGMNLEETYLRIKEVCAILLEENPGRKKYTLK